MARTAGTVKLSRREEEVAALVAEGLTDREIAKRLFLSDRTAEGHVQSIRNKLGFDTRAQIAGWYARRHPSGTSSEADPAPTSLPLQLTSFIGREAELAEVRRLMERSRLVTILGPGGAGKTRLAIQTGEDRLRRGQTGIWFADLGAMTGPAGVLQSIGAALEVRESEAAELEQAIGFRLRDRGPGLLILDNCEHLIDEAARVADLLLRSAGELRVLCTSREPLLVSGEAVARLPALSLPSRSDGASVDEVRRTEAAQLFCDRAGLSQPDFELSPANAGQVAALCISLDGVALALELAAAQVGILGLEGVIEGLAAGPGVLKRRGGPARHRSLDAAVRWSYDLLEPALQRLLRQLAVFRGGFNTDAAIAVCGATPDQLAGLADRSLLVALPGEGSRWRMLETIRQCAEEWLREAGEWELARERHLDHFAGLARAAEPGLAGPEHAVWLRRLTADHPNLLAALAASRNREGEQRTGFALALYRFWAVSGRLTEGRAWLEDALGAPGGEESTRAGLMNAAAGIAWRQGEFAAARRHLEASLAIRRRLADPKATQPCLANLGVVAASQGEYEGAAAFYRESLALASANRDPRAIAILKSNLGLAMHALGEEERAEMMAGESLAEARALGEPVLTGQTLVNLGIINLEQGRVSVAKALLQESLLLLAEVGSLPDVANCLEKLGWVAAVEGDSETALTLAAGAEGIRRRIGAPSTPSPFRRRITAALDAAREELGPRADQVWAGGLEMTAGEAIGLGRRPTPGLP